MIAGSAGGPNSTEQTSEALRKQLNRPGGKKSDPLTNQRLPRSQREHAKQYFEQLRKGGD